MRFLKPIVGIGKNYPPANGKKYNYFIYNNLVVYSKNELEYRIKMPF